MDFTTQQKKRIDYFRRSVRLDDVTTANDPAYKFSDEDLWGILEVSAPIHLGNTIDETPDKDFYFVLLLAKREIYYRLATTTAPFYPLSAEGAKLEKNIRFDHYIKLVNTVMEEYDKLYESKFGGGDDDVTGTGGVVTTYQSKVYGKPYLHRYDQLTDEPLIEVVPSGITSFSVNLDWDKFDSTMGSDFSRYEVYVSDDLIYDEYSPTPTKITMKPIYVIEDIRKTKIRVLDLEPDKEYYVLVKVASRLGLIGYSQVKVKTLSDVPNGDAEIPIGGDA